MDVKELAETAKKKSRTIQETGAGGAKAENAERYAQFPPAAQ